MGLNRCRGRRVVLATLRPVHAYVLVATVHSNETIGLIKVWHLKAEEET